MIRTTRTVQTADTASEAMLADVLRGLSQRQKRLPTRYLYDERGARLFERICELDEYYLTRTEMNILRCTLPEIAALLGPRTLVFEPGSGAGEKIRLLLGGLDRPSAYVPIDIAREQLVANASRLQEEFPDVDILPVCADFMNGLHLPVTARRVDRLVAFFPGSTIGNVTQAGAVALLRRLRRIAGREGKLLIGVDLQKDRAILEPAYDDADGVSAEFAMNYLVRMNRELGADFSVDCFCYSARYNARLGRIEMYLVSLCEQLVEIGGHSVRFRAGERVRTEVSYKYTLESFAAVAGHAALRVERVWTDPRNNFSVQLLARR